MLKKLLKYDLKWCFKPLIVFYILAIFFAALTRLFGLIEDSLIFIVIQKICSGTTIAMLINILINNLMRVWARTVRNLYKDESYLTHTIPVKREIILFSKILTAIISMFISFIVIIGCLAIGYLNKENWQLIKTAMEQTAIYFNSSISSVVITITITIFFEVLFMVISGILGILIGYKTNNLKTVKSIAAGFILYTIPSMLSIAIIYIMGLINPSIMKLFTTVNSIDTEALKITLYGAIAMYIIYNVIYCIAGKKILDKGVNIE